MLPGERLPFTGRVHLLPDGSVQVAQLEGSDDALAALPEVPAVFLIFAESGRPYLAKTTVLRRRALRLLAKRSTQSRLFYLREAFSRLEYWLTGSALDASMRLYELARIHFASEYARMLRLRMPSYVKLLLSDPWPRTTIATYLGGAPSLMYGPFRSRNAAEQFEAEFLELFPIRRCQGNLAPAPDHPGCIYGEVNKCVRPCQLAVSHDDYALEIGRAGEFLRTEGRSLVQSITAARDQLSADMDFEEAARQHRRLEKVEEVLRSRDGLAGNVESLHGVVVTRAAAQGAVHLSFLRGGYWQGSMLIAFEAADGKPVSMDRKLKETWGTLPFRKSSTKERAERLAILARWFYSSWCDGEFLLFPRFEDPPIRKLVNAISRVLAASNVH